MATRNARRGQTAVLFTLAIVPLFGVLGLVIDIGWAYYRKEAAQTAADAAAGAAALAAYNAASAGAPTCSMTGVSCDSTGYDCPSTLTTASNNVQSGCLYAMDNGFTTAGKQRVTILSGTGTPPTASGASVAYWVEVKVTERVPQLFSAVLGFPNALVAARATTGTRVTSAGGCVIALNPGASGTITMTGGATLTTGCGVFDNSNAADALTVNGTPGTPAITTTGTAKTDVVGGVQGSTSNISPAARTGRPVMSDPFADMDPPTWSGCTNTGVSGGSHDVLSLPGSTTVPTVICGDLSLGSQSSLALGPGLYIVTGNISLGAQTTMTGSGVTFYLPNGGANMSGGAHVTLSAPDSGTWQGILFYQRRGNTTGSSLVGQDNQQLNGVLYFPSAQLTYNGGSSAVATHTTLVSYTLRLVGNSSIAAAAPTSYTGVTGGVSVIE